MTTEQTPGRRRRRDRGRTEAELLAAARRQLERDGVLAGLNLQEVATEAGVNRGQIYQFYGSRQALLRAALAEMLRSLPAERPDHWDRDFADRRKAMIRWALGEPLMIRLEALLALDGDEEFHTLPAFRFTRKALARDQETGALPEDADGEALHVLTASAYMGYVIFREAMARDTGIPLDELDERVIAAYDRIIDQVVHGE